MIDVTAAMNGLGDAARPAAPGAPGRGAGDGRERAAGQSFAAMVDRPEQSAPGGAAEGPKDEAELARPEKAAEAGASSAQPDALLCWPDTSGTPATPRGAGQGSPEEADPAQDDGTEAVGGEAWVEPGNPAFEVGPVAGPAGPALYAVAAPSSPVGPEHRAGVGGGEGPAAAFPLLRAPGTAGASRAESVLAALVAAQSTQGRASGGPAGADADPLQGQKNGAVAFGLPAAVAGNAPLPMAGKVAEIVQGEDQDRPSLASGASPEGALTGGEGEDPAGGVPRLQGAASALGGKARALSTFGTGNSDQPVRDAVSRSGGGPSVASDVTVQPGAGGRARAETGLAGAFAGVSALRHDKDSGASGPEPAWPEDRAWPFAAGPVESGPLSAPSDGPQTARHIARQVADHPVLRTGGAAETNLNPEELGPLRLTVEGSEGALRVVIEAARPETADLLRRHVETLRQELRQEGLGSVGVSIGGGDPRQGGEAAPRGGPSVGERSSLTSAALGPSPSLDPPAARGRTPTGQLDLRF